MKFFNTEGVCFPDKHYMVPLDERVAEIKRRFIERGSYFVINRGRQYGKTTTLRFLHSYLSDEYTVIMLDFQNMSQDTFENERTFARSFADYLIKTVNNPKLGMSGIDMQLIENLEEKSKKDDDQFNLMRLFDCISDICDTAEKPVILMIDEVDCASNNQVFIDFLSQLRYQYLNKDTVGAFHSVILAGVHDIKNLKAKIRPEEEYRYNSPWNIAANFDIGMSLSPEGINAMLMEYEKDNNTGMDTERVSRIIYDYTSGYPVLVSWICKIIDENLMHAKDFKCRQAWSREGIDKAVKIILNEKAPLFDHMAKYLERHEGLRTLLENIIYRGMDVASSVDVDAIDKGIMFGYFTRKNGRTVVSNRIFEMRLMNKFAAEEGINSDAYIQGGRDKNQFINNGKLDMDLVLRKFVSHYSDIYGDNDEKFIEKYGRKFFLLYLKPIINGTGNYYLEAETRDYTRTDVVVDYAGEQFVIEMKIWHGEEYNERGEKQLMDYLDYFHLDRGYMLSFNFNKTKQVGIQEIKLGDKVIVEAVV